MTRARMLGRPGLRPASRIAREGHIIARRLLSRVFSGRRDGAGPDRFLRLYAAPYLHRNTAGEARIFGALQARFLARNAALR
jgi:hypothetical protein